MLSPNLLKSKVPIFGGGGEGSWKFDAESRFAKIHKFPLGGGGICGNLMLSPNLLKSKVPIFGGGGGVS